MPNVVPPMPPEQWLRAFERKIPIGKRGEELFQLILSGIREIYDVNAVIAGGAVRDLAAGVTDHKDVDVFVPLLPNELIERYVELGWQGDLIQIGRIKDSYSKKKKEGPGCLFDTVARFQSVVQGVKVDLVITKEPLSVDNVKTFPVHAQRGVWTLENGKELFPEAQKDIDNKTFTIDLSITDKDTVEHVLNKIKEWKRRAAYKDWQIIEPEIKEWWEVKEAVAEDEKKVPNSLDTAYAKQMLKWWMQFEEKGDEGEIEIEQY